ncbi:YopX family protein [Alkalihalophilus marmarensis]|uniref:YopX family protein n=1 Tax=Alkalihalophilus marmarensis TaxID=521377 RepID=UPI00203D3956|nr:YopX family protein [Alkalihalophilus marmarensis]MCM3487876.1 YopX family protein [Alkalihalophilus marmarensis]
MRNIKFRVYDKCHKRTHVVGEEQHDSLTCFDGDVKYYNLQNGEGSGEHGDYILMQYTGIDDKNGTEIYEGDIVTGNRIIYEFSAVVKSGEFEQDASGGEYSGAMCVGFYGDLLNKEKLDEWELQEYPEYIHTISLAEIVDLEVIGNIYEHPHLLESDS